MNQRILKKLTDLTDSVKSAEHEMALAVMFHETWKPTVYDTALQERMGHSYATNTFVVVRIALRRELMLAVMRFWDRDNRSISFTRIRDLLKNDQVFDALVLQRAKNLNMSSPFVSQALRKALIESKDDVLTRVHKYSEGGAGVEVLERLRQQRNEQLAHKQIQQADPESVSTTDKEVEAVYQDTIELMRILMSLVRGHAFNPKELAHVYEHHARFFWAGVRGERTEGHPNYRSPVSNADGSKGDH